MLMHEKTCAIAINFFLMIGVNMGLKMLSFSHELCKGIWDVR